MLRWFGKHSKEFQVLWRQATLLCLKNLQFSMGYLLMSLKSFLFSHSFFYTGNMCKLNKSTVFASRKMGAFTWWPLCDFTTLIKFYFSELAKREVHVNGCKIIWQG
ncbi:hypothetical protein AABB24_009491 [Solanum stoloniferum]|uniref:Uncharacterized protein n=1 Tax=Solanum stoloniferum TaxID=62892 RepID=A0ABD2UIR0_9SOLN